MRARCGRAPPRQSTAAIRAKIKGAGIEHIFLVGSHTHHGPVLELDDWPDAKTSYVRQLEQKLADLILEANKALKRVEKVMGKKFGSEKNPLLLSVRSGARKSMPGMMDTVLNIGLTSETIPGLIKQTSDARFVYDAYRRLITMYADVVMEKAAGVEPKDDQGIRRQLDRLLEARKHERGVKNDTDLSAADLKDLCEKYKAKVLEVLGKPFPDDPAQQLWGGIGAVFSSWNGKRAISYRRIEGIAIPNAYWRDDIGATFADDMDRLLAWGWLRES